MNELEGLAEFLDSSDTKLYLAAKSDHPGARVELSEVLRAFFKWKAQPRKNFRGEICTGCKRDGGYCSECQP